MEQTESLVESVSPDSWALGSEIRPSRDESTRVESPAARSRTHDSARPHSAPELPPPPPPPRRRRAAGRHRSDDPAERIGRVLGSYRLLDVLGKGGMGCVYRAEHIKLGREVALKLLRADYAERRDAVARFFQEARAVNRIRHRNIVDATDFVELDDGTTFIIMELLDGLTLGHWARKRDAPQPQILAMLIQICDALIAAHGVGIVHRDLKPDNIFIVPTGDGAEIVKLLDFGVAKLLTPDDEEEYGLETAAGSVIGTPAYMSPEQAGGMPVDGRSDVYSLGAIMYELFTGAPMFRAKSFGEYVRKHLSEQPTPPRDTPGGQDIDESLESVILKCLAKSPDDRYDSVDDLREDLLHLLGAIDTSLPAENTVLPSSRRPPSTARRGPAMSSRSGPPSTARRGPAMSSAIHSMSTASLSPRPRPKGEPTTAEAYETAMAVGGVPSEAPVASSSAGLWIAGLAAVAAAAIVAVVLIAKSGGGERNDATHESRAAATTDPTNDPVSKASTGPVVTPMDDETIELDAEHIRPSAETVTVRFTSTPRASVSAAGSAMPLCPTPCDVTIDPADGGSSDRRDFVIHQKGYADSPISIDLHDPQETVNVVLERRTTARKTTHSTPVTPDLAPTTVDPTPPKSPRDDTILAPDPVRDIDPSDTLNPFGNK